MNCRFLSESHRRKIRVSTFPTFAIDLQNVWLKRVRAKSFGQVKLVGSLGQTWGALGFAHSKALESADLAEAMLRIYGYRAAAELERELADERFYTDLLDALQGPIVG